MRGEPEVMEHGDHGRAVALVEMDKELHDLHLMAQVQVCNTQLSLSYFPDDEANVAAFLDREHYRFAP